MRFVFIGMRFIGYVFVLCTICLSHSGLRWWQWGISVPLLIWSSWDQWKRPEDPEQRLRWGIWLEFLLIVFWGILLRDSSVLFLLVSPLMRACIHMQWMDSTVLLAGEIASYCILQQWFPLPMAIKWIQLAVILLLGFYSFVIGELVRSRNRIQRLESISMIERQEHLKNAERVELAGQLHDGMGQYWTAVIRALDVALLLEGDAKESFLVKARQAAIEGLQQMREAVHGWHEGTRTPSQWMREAELAIERYRNLAGVEIQIAKWETNWERFQSPAAAAETAARTLIETLTNAVRHGNSSRVQIELKSDQQRLELLVQDNGKGRERVGFESGSEKIYESGIGISSIQRKAEELGGTASWEFNSRIGTKMQLILPYETGLLSGANQERGAAG